MTCLAESQIQRFFERTLSDAANAAIEQHVDECGACRKVLLDVASGFAVRTSSSPNGETPSQNAGIAPDDFHFAPSNQTASLSTGTLIENRYLVLEMIGMGGMGRVYAAYDRQLDRKVALKLLRHEGEDAHERLVGEAKALAKLSHPNVVVVHDIGTAFGQTFMAMEYVEGRTLRQWIAAEHPDSQRILHEYLEAAKGLAAAHAAGLVHRDFKPDNVLIGNDARVRVTDFGLARPLRIPAMHLDESEEISFAENRENAPTTRLEGTLSYIAPERFEGKPSDARSDQFAFCVALYEGLYKEYPFECKVLTDLPKAIKTGRVRPAPKGSRVQPRIRTVLLKGLAPDPAIRHSSMDSLIAALQGAQRRTKSLHFAILALLLITGASVLASALRPSSASNGEPVVCKGSERKLEGIWDETQKSAIKKTLLASKLPYATDTWQTVQSSMNGYAQRWVVAHREACVATRVYGEQSEDVLDRRTACLEMQLREFGALSHALTEATGEAVTKAAEASQKLADPSLCKSIEVIRDYMLPPQNDSVRIQVETLRTRLAKLEAKSNLGESNEILDETRSVFNEAETLGYQPLQAEAGLLSAVVFRGKKSPTDMRRSLERALLAAESGRHERAALRIWLEFANFCIWKGACYNDAEMHLKHAEAYLQRMDGNLERLRLFTHRSALYRGQARPTEALEEAKKALTHAETVFGPDSFHTISALMEVGINSHLAKQREPSREAFRRGINIAERLWGKKHPVIARLSINFGLVLMGQEPTQSDEYLAVFRRAADIAALEGGDLHGHASSSLATAMVTAKRYEEALQFIDQAISSNGPTLDPVHPDRVTYLADQAIALVGLHRTEEGCNAFLKAYALAKEGPAFKRIMPGLLDRARMALGPCDKPVCKKTLDKLITSAKAIDDAEAKSKAMIEPLARDKDKHP